MNWQAVGQYVAYLVVRVFVCLLQSLSMQTCQEVARTMAWLCAHVVGFRDDVVDENLHIAFPEWNRQQRRQLARRMWEHLFVLLVEMAHTPRKIHETNWREFVTMHRGPELCRILLEQRPTLLVSAHFGNFEMGSYIMGILGFPTHSVARTLDNPYLDRFLLRFRGARGQHIVPKKGGYDRIVEILNSKGVMSFLADQYAGSKGCWVEFFSRPASAHKAIALFALDNDARLVVCFARRTGGPLSCELGVEEVFDPRAPVAAVDSIKSLTQWYTTQLEHVVRRDPGQYWWVHRRWKDNRPARRRAKEPTGDAGAA